jgi:hypothetical protein
MAAIENPSGQADWRRKTSFVLPVLRAPAPVAADGLFIRAGKKC